jgi:hypothetical protein
VAIDPHAPAAEPTATAPAASAIENELPTYRAISPLAVGSLVLGVAGLLAFADLVWLVAPVLAIVAGALALGRIRKQPEVLTGRGFAQAGIALGLITGLSSVTIDYTQRMLTSRAAENYVKQTIVPRLNARDLDGALWLKTHPDQRRGMTPQQVMEMYRQRNEADPMAFQSVAGPVVALNKILEVQPQARIVFDRIEHTDFDGMTPVAIVLMKVENLKDLHDLPKGTEGAAPNPLRGTGIDPDDPGLHYVGVSIKAVGNAGNQSWWVEDYKYPCMPASLKLKEKPIDDGHGHGPGQH